MTPHVPDGWGSEPLDPAAKLSWAVDQMRAAMRQLDDARETAVAVLAELRAKLAAEREG